VSTMNADPIRQDSSAERIAGFFRRGDAHTFTVFGKTFLFLKNTATLLKIDDGVEARASLAPLNPCGWMLDPRRAQIVLDLMEVCGRFSCGRVGGGSSSAGKPRHGTNGWSNNLTVFLANGCNLSCIYCYETASGRGPLSGRFDDGLLRQFLSEFISENPFTTLLVSFFGGEPLIEFEKMRRAVEFADSFARSRGKQIVYRITTNGTLMSPEAADFFVGHRFAVLVSLDGPEHVHDRNRPRRSGGPSFSDVCGNLSHLVSLQRKEGQPAAQIRCTLSTRDLGLRADVIEYFEHAFPLSPVYLGEDFTRFGDEEIGDSDWQYFRGAYESYVKDLVSGKPLKRVYVPGMQTLAKIWLVLGGKWHLKTDGISCGFGRQMITAASNGRYYPCHRFVGMPGCDVGTAGAGVQWAAVNDLIARIENNRRAPCESCWAERICEGSCPYRAAGPPSLMGRPEKTLCDIARMGFEYILWVYSEVEERRAATCRARARVASSKTL
jgi:uncharacterized protein